MIRKLAKTEYPQAIELSLAVFTEGKHISLFFIKPIYHRRGIGRKLFDYAYTLNGLSTTEITVNASTYAVPFYESLGFQPIGDAQCYHGLTSIPMKKRKQL